MYATITVTTTCAEVGAVAVGATHSWIGAIAGLLAGLLTAPVPAGHKILGWVAMPGPPFSGSNGVGLYLLASTDPTASHTPVWWMSNGGQDANDPTPTTPETNCTGLGLGSTSAISDSTHTDLSRIPSYDMYGNALNPASRPYHNSSIVGGSMTSIYTSGSELDQTQKVLDYDWGLAIWNSVDSAANNLRNDSNFANRAGAVALQPRGLCKMCRPVVS